MRRRAGLPVALVLLAAAPAAHAADFRVAPQDYSPKVRRMLVTAQLPQPARVGVQLVSAEGAALGWIAPPQRRRYLRMRWNGRIEGERVPDGRYEVRLVRPGDGRVLAAFPLAVDRVAPRLIHLRAFTRSNRPFAGDKQLLTTISPNGDKLRDAARISFTLTEQARVRFEVTRTLSAPVSIYELTATLGPGRHTLTWFPKKDIGQRTYLVHLTAEDTAGNRRLYGASNAESGRRPSAPVIRVLGVDAGFTRESYVPGEKARLVVETDARSLQLQIFRAGLEEVPTYNDTIMNGVALADPVTVPWQGRQDRPGALSVDVGQWGSGLYFAKLTADDGRIGFAPFIVRAATPGASRVAIVLPTNTWQAYNFRDVDGNGWGDTWYAKGAQSTVRLGRAFLRRGVPPQYRKYDLGFLRWLARTNKQPEFLSESDLEVVDSGDTLAKIYDLIVFSGHTEYVTRKEYDLAQRYRDLGGNLMFLSANNFFWEVRRQGSTLRRTKKWRELGRPESALIGVQYRANDNGRTQRPFVVRAAATAPWLFAGTGLGDGSEFGPLGGYGIEIDAASPQSPPGTIVLAEIPDIYGPGLTAQMTYYETPEGAKVFAAGALDVGGTALEPPVTQLLENLWARLSAP